MEWQDDDGKPDEDIRGQNVSHRCKVVIVGTNNLKSFTYDVVRTNDASVINASILVQVLSEFEADQEYMLAILCSNFLKSFHM